MSQTEITHLWRIAQGVEDPKAYAKSVLTEMGVDYDAEQERINAQHAADGCACAGTKAPIGFGIPALRDMVCERMRGGLTQEEAIAAVAEYGELRSEAIEALRFALSNAR